MSNRDKQNTKGADDYFVPRLFIVIPVLVALILAIVGWTAHLSDSQRIQAIWALIGVLLGLILTVLYRHFEVYRSLGDAKRSLDASISANNSVVQLNNRMAKIEFGLRSDEQFSKLCAMNDTMGAIASTRLRLATFSDLIRWKEERIFSHWQTALAELSEGLIEIDDAHKELNTNEVFLRTIPQARVRAVSFEDEEFWGSPEGMSFLNAHKELSASRGVKITRIFIVDGDIKKYEATFDHQRECGIDVRYLPRTSITDDSIVEDFVIYDDEAVRVGYRAADSTASRSKLINKFARITVRRDEVDRYVEAFEFLFKRSFTASGSSPDNRTLGGGE